MEIISNDIKRFLFFPIFERNKENVLETSWAETDLSAGHFLLKK